MCNIDWLVRQITTNVRGGRTPMEAYKELCEVCPPNVVRQALTRFEEMTGRIRTLKQPASLEREGLSNWYPGPSDEDRFWPPLRNSMHKRGWSAEAVDSIDQASTKVISLLQPPGLGNFSTKGLVVGYVQSGKTANFSAVIAKAADVGYKFFIVLSGITNPLRSQTQIRLERELVNLNGEDWYSLTTVTDDFRILGAIKNVDAFLTDHHSQKVLCVVKKNATVLKRLLKWLRAAHKEVLGNCPVLIIDDEADQASVNASSVTGGRTAINGLLLDIIAELPRSAYIGYTATPFANLFIDPVASDLYPEDFIVDLPKPEEYFGAERIFGRERLTNDQPEDQFDGLDLIHTVPDDEVPLLKPKGPNDRSTFEPQLTPSLATALRYFWLATAARSARGDENAHSTMLIHTTLYTDVHGRFQPLIDRYRTTLLRGLKAGKADLLGKLRDQWDEEQSRVPSVSVNEAPTSFDDLLPYLVPVMERSEVVIENSRSVLRLEYGEKGRVQIVIGGNTLSRGLTLEGLVVSFFVRTSSAYDTLLQMGRWFGYRRGYADLPRVWMTKELEGYFFDLATVEQEIRIDVNRYELEQLTPKEFGVRIRTHPVLEITSKLKMQAAVPCDVSYSGRRLQTILFNHKDATWLQSNINATKAFISAIRTAGGEPIRRENTNILFRDVPVGNILKFLNTYAFHPNSQELRPDLLRDYIRAQNKDGELVLWNVVIIGRQSEDEGHLDLAPDIQVPLLTRSKVAIGTVTEYANLKAIMSEVDRVADLDLSSAEIKGKDPVVLRTQEKPGVGLLLLYPISKDSKPKPTNTSGRRKPLEAAEHLIGVGLVFPEASKLTPQRYMTVDLSNVEREVEPEVQDEEEEGAAV